MTFLSFSDLKVRFPIFERCPGKALTGPEANPLTRLHFRWKSRLAQPAAPLLRPTAYTYNGQMNKYRQSQEVSNRLADTPEERPRPFDDSGDVRAPGLIQQDEAERCVDDVVEGSLVEAAHGHFLLVERLRIKAGSDLGLDLRAAVHRTRARSRKAAGEAERVAWSALGPTRKYAAAQQVVG